jgi:chromosome segregation ATPase
MAAAQAELAAERRSTAKMRVTVQERQAAIDALKQRVADLKTETHKQDANLAALKAKNAKMESTLEHFRRHMRERESTLEGKEAGIVDLRRKNLTLDNFRFVLDHRVAQLMEERGPVADHIRSLEK